MVDVQRHPYHSQLRPPVEAAPVDRFALGASVAFRHDLRDGMPGEYDSCAVLYAELPWQNGLDTFNSRAGVEATYKEFVAAVAVAVISATVPTILVTGKHALARLPEPKQVLPVDLNGTPSIAIIYGATTKPANTATELIVRMADRFDRVGDFCCGYGRTLRLFHQAGKTFVGSDYNAHCIGYIAGHAGQWPSRV